MSVPKISIVIPYKQRLTNLESVFESLVEQTMQDGDFEVVVGAMEYDPAYVEMCRRFTGRFPLVSVLTAEDWNTSRARNLGIRHASGQVVTVLDADVALAPQALQTLWERYFQHGQNTCVVGQLLGYEETVSRDTTAVDSRPWAHFRQALADLRTADRAALDPRFSDACAPAVNRFPWAFARTGLMALPTATLRRHGLELDEGFLGWGAEDQEWALRISRTGTPLVMAHDVYGIHLPHERDLEAQDRSAHRTNRYYLGKWPSLGLELTLAFGGWVEADRLYAQAEREVARAAGGRRLGVVHGTRDGRSLVAVGAVLDSAHRLADPRAEALFDSWTEQRVLPLAGFALPFEDGEVETCRLLPAVSRLGERYRNAVVREATRVCATTPEVVQDRLAPVPEAALAS